MTMGGTALDADRLLRAAEAAAGSADWGTPPFREALDRLLASARDEAGLSAAQADAFAANIHRLLVNRLLIYADRARHPEIALQRIVAPIVVTGLPRSGTTILHGLLAQDPAARSPLRWEIERPSPPPRAESYASDPRIAAAQADVERLPAAFRAMHAMGAELPEECNGIMAMAFLSPNFGATARLPSYMRWLLTEADIAPGFAFHRHVLQHFQAFAPGERWVLKSPPHLWWLDALVAAYPDVRIVVTHRDPAEVMASNASLIAFLRGGNVDRLQLGREQTAEWLLAVDRATAWRQAGAGGVEVADSYYTEFLSDPMAVVRGLYTRFGLTLTAAAEARMRAFLDRNRQGKHGAHVYSAADYGMTAESVRAEFAAYVAANAVPLGRA